MNSERIPYIHNTTEKNGDILSNLWIHILTSHERLHSVLLRKKN